MKIIPGKQWIEKRRALKDADAAIASLRALGASTPEQEQAADMRRFFEQGATIKQRGDAPNGRRPFFRAAAVAAAFLGISAISYGVGADAIHMKGVTDLAETASAAVGDLAGDATAFAGRLAEATQDAVGGYYNHSFASTSSDTPQPGPKKPGDLGLSVQSDGVSLEVTPPLPRPKPQDLGASSSFQSPPPVFLDRARQHLTLILGDYELAEIMVANALRQSEQLEPGGVLTLRPFEKSASGALRWSPYEGEYDLNGPDGNPYFSTRGGQVVLDGPMEPDLDSRIAVSDEPQFSI